MATIKGWIRPGSYLDIIRWVGEICLVTFAIKRSNLTIWIFTSMFIGAEIGLYYSEIAENASKKCYKQKFFICPSGKEIICQGYEPFALKELIELNITENDIVTGSKNVPIIWYNDKNGKKRRHYVDIFIPSINKCIEVKSLWTLNKENSNIFEKQNEAKKLGYNYEIWVYDVKGDKIATHL